ncbi:hypothetical protein SS1G_04637 [Sclerotinia sclerotiorum 1980 UF-70]|uniref:Uncharacterized protein n=1 Tax=Sclerotinia sclerotiorum (strain ATCC 18683 / 1980 / Ss-1) TaxID=665079 RepID=A7EH45_SCLS1|nr:hypothetical protein SS1G_04637 [Sclerotinia sclerotiorum 1980 UF-70]EDO02161.1 hypothetical protein SS1G_04637 [Sclerotinia sclerotiorum 1980 UF-70]
MNVYSFFEVRTDPEVVLSLRVCMRMFKLSRSFKISVIILISNFDLFLRTYRGQRVA